MALPLKKITFFCGLPNFMFLRKYEKCWFRLFIKRRHVIMCFCNQISKNSLIDMANLCILHQCTYVEVLPYKEYLLVHIGAQFNYLTVNWKMHDFYQGFLACLVFQEIQVQKGTAERAPWERIQVLENVGNINSFVRSPFANIRWYIEYEKLSPKKFPPIRIIFNKKSCSSVCFQMGGGGLY